MMALTPAISSKKFSFPQTSHLGQLIYDNLSENQDKIMQINGKTGATETKGVVLRRSVSVARHLLRLGIREKDVVTICAYNHNNTILPLVGSLYIGACISGLDMRMSKAEYAHVLRITQPRILFCDPSIALLFESIIEETCGNTRIVLFGESTDKRWISFSEFLKEDNNIENFKVTPIDPDKTLAYILCSSGSTGLPKGVAHTHKRLLQHVIGVKEAFKGATMVQFSSIYWLSGLAMAMLNLLIETVRVNAAPFTPELFFDYVKKYKANLIMVTPSVVRIILNSKQLLTSGNLSTIKILMVAGSTVDFDELTEMQKYVPNGVVINSYGLSEIGGPVTFTPGEVKRGTCGKILPFMEYKLTDPDTGIEIMEPNIPGELHLRAPCMMRGYYRNPEETAQAMDSEGWLHTGDLVKIDEDGYLYIVDRLKEVFKYMGYGIAPATLEGVINNHPGVKEAIVIGIDNKDTGHVPMAIVQRAPGSTITAQEVKDLIKKNLTDYSQLRGGVAFVEHYEMTPSGKVKRNVLRKNVHTLNIELKDV